MKNIYTVTFRWYDTNTYCSNICIADSAEAVKARYEDSYTNVWVTEGTERDLQDAQRRGKPIVKI